MGKTYRTTRPMPNVGMANISPDRLCKESTLTRFSKAWKKITHHRERQSLRTAIMNEMQESV